MRIVGGMGWGTAPPCQPEVWVSACLPLHGLPLPAPQALAAARKGGRSGDADLPSREPLYERRAKFDSVRARQQVR